MPLPPGLLLNRETGELTGIPTVAGTYSIQLKVRDVLGSERELVDEVVINAYDPMEWSGDLGNLMENRVAAQITVALAGGLAPHQYAIFSGNLPDGLLLNEDTGAITGTPTTEGGYAVVIRVTDALSQAADVVLAGTVVEELVVDYDATESGTVGYTMDIAASTVGGTAPHSYAITSGTLPAGLSFDEETGAITGIPTATNSGSITVTVTDDNGFTDSDTFDFDIVAAPTIAGSLIRGMVNKAYSRTLTGSGGHTPYTWSVSGQPTGLSIPDSSVGTLSGTPSAAGTFATVVTLTDALGIVDTFEGSIEIAAELNIAGTYGATPTLGLPYSFSPTVTGGYAPYAFDISAGSLPAGLTLNASTGLISGAPNTEAIYSATLRVTDADGSADTMAIDISVNGIVVMSGSVPALGTTTVAFTGDNLSVAGGVAPRTWSVASGALPTGLSLNTSTGDITGTPTVAGTFNYTIKVTDANLSSDQEAFSTTVAAFPTLTGALPDGTNGVAYSEQMTRTGGHLPVAFDISAGALPDGLTIHATTGVISGTPTTVETASFTVRVTDNAGNVATNADSIQIFAAPAISGTITNEAEIGDPYSATQLSVTGGKAPIQWTLAGGTLPAGLTLNASNGDITGTPDHPAVAGIFNFNVRVTDALGRTHESSQTIDLRARLQLTGGSRPDRDRTAAYTGTTTALYGWTPYTFAIVAGALPTGVSIDANTGELSGTPSAAGTFNFTTRATDALGVTSDFADTIVITQPVDITGPAEKGTIGVAYVFTPFRTGGFPTFYYTKTAGFLPTGTVLQGNTGTIYGTPSGAPATHTPTIHVLSSGGSTDSLGLSITIAAFPTLTLNYPRGTVGEVYFGDLTPAGGHLAYTFSRIAGSAIPGVALNGANGNMSGVPSLAGTYNFTILLTDSMGNNVQKSTTVSIASALSIVNSFPNGKDGTAYSAGLSGTGGWAPRTFSVVSGSLPAGLSMSAAGVLSGTPTTPQTANFTVRMTDADSDTVDKAMTVVIAAATPFNVVASPSNASDTTFTPLGASSTASASSTATASGGSGTGFTYSWAYVSSPDGGATQFTRVTSNGGRTLTCSHTGTPIYERTEKWRCTAHDSLGATDTFDVNFTLVHEANF